MLRVFFCICCFYSFSFAQTYPNNQQYIDSPLTAIDHQKDLLTQKEFITLKTNIMRFNTPQGEFYLNFVFHRDISLITPTHKIEMILETYSSNIIMPFDNFEQKINLSVTDEYFTYLWKTVFSFNAREANAIVDKNGKQKITLKKIISIEEFNQLQGLFNSPSMTVFAINGFYGDLRFALPSEITMFYREFFNYKQKIYKN